MSSHQVKRKGPMPDIDYVKIQANFCYLVDHIKEPVRLGNKLFEKNVFNVDEKDEIKKIYLNAEQGRWAAADKLVTYILNCSDTYGKFIQCLQELGYREIVNVLENTTNGKNKTNLMTEQDKTRHQLEELHKDHDLTKQELGNLKKQVETLKTRQDGDSKQLLKKIEKREHELEIYKKQTEEKEVLTKKRMDELETCIKTLTVNDEDTRKQQQQQLFDACRHGTLYDIKNMVNIDVNVRGGWNQTPLFTCCVSSVSPVDKIKYLVSHGADINARNCYNRTILHQACYSGTLSTVQYLVGDLHMDVNTTSYNNQTPLFTCCESSVSPVDKIKYLVSHGADINARDSDNDTILHQACIDGTLCTVQYLVDCLHLDLHVKSKHGKTPLDYCRWSHIESRDEKIKYIRDQMKLK